jgi:hypothetical protein
MKPDFTIEASNFYLSQELPLDYSCWDDESIDGYVVNFAWEPFESWSAEDMWEVIVELATAFEKMYNEGKGSNDKG